MIDYITQDEKEAFIAMLDPEDKMPTCDLDDGSVEEIAHEVYYDDLSSKELPAQGVEAARAEDMSVIKALRPKDERVIGTRWADINKGDTLHMKPRSLHVAQELKRQTGPKVPEGQSSWIDFFAAMPPLSSLRALFALATTRKVPNDDGKLTPMDGHGKVCVMFIDVRKLISGHPSDGESGLSFPQGLLKARTALGC